MENPDVNFYLRKRYFVCFWIFLGYVVSYILRSNLSIALVEMTSEKLIITANGTITKAPEFDWDPKKKGFLISLSSYGLLFSPFSGVLAARFGGVRIFCFGICISAVLSFVTPFLLRYSFYLLAAARTLEGLADSLISPSFMNIFTRWAPPKERSRLIIFSFTGLYAGTCINYTLCGFLALNYGVNMLFFITGGIGLTWSTICFLFIPTDPAKDRLMTSRERNYFKTFAQNTTLKKISFMNYPWKAILRSKPVWAIFNEYFCSGWITAFTIFILPLYIKDIFNVNVQAVGYISSIILLCNLCGLVGFSCLADYLRSNGVGVAKIHRLYAAIGQLSAAVFLLIISLWANYTQSIILFCIMRFLAGSGEGTYQVVLVDMFCEYSGLIRGIAAIWYSLATILSPTLMGFMVTNHSQSSWNLYFLIISAFNIFGLVIFFIFGSGELQDWAAPKTKDESEKKNSTCTEDK